MCTFWIIIGEIYDCIFYWFCLLDFVFMGFCLDVILFCIVLLVYFVSKSPINFTT